MDDLCSATIFSGSDAGSGSKDGCSVDLSSSCLAVEPTSGSFDDDREGHPDHLYDMSSLMAQLPQIRRGLSRFYDGKSRSFRSLGSIKAMEDLPEPEPGRRRSRGNSCRKQTIDANMHGCSKTSRVIRKATRNVRPPSRPRSPSDGWCVQNEELRMRRCLP